jgi:hypothetical protein
VLSMQTAALCVTDWHHPLCLDGGGYWRARIPVAIHNDKDVALEGDPVVLRIGSEDGAACLIGVAAESIRLTSASGIEMLFAMTGPNGQRISRGPVPAGAKLVIPTECPARSSATYYVYFDNPHARGVPDSLAVRSGLINGDLERGQGDVPTGWRHDARDANHRTEWSKETPQSGKRCLKTTVSEGAEPTWIATRQHGIVIVGGAKYRMQAWVKAEDVNGYAGWYVHLGNRDNPMLAAPMLSGGDGTYDWKQVTAEFVAPADADRASLGTVLRGTGTAWFDNVTLECLEPGKIRVHAGEPQRKTLRHAGDTQPWHVEASDKPDVHNRRATAKVLNFSNDATDDSLVSIDLTTLQARACGRLNLESLTVTCGGKAIECAAHGNCLLFEATLAARSVTAYQVYFSDESPSGTERVKDYRSLILNARNLVKNPSFEQGTNVPAGWTQTGSNFSADDVTYELDSPGRADLGTRCVRMHVPPVAPIAWRGWHQSVPVEPGGQYLLAGMVKCSNVEEGEVRIHAHRRTADGGLSRFQPYLSVGPGISGTTDWTLLSGLVTIPEDTVTLQIHLTTDKSGTVWHDGVFLAKVVPGRIVSLEGRPQSEDSPLAVWQVPAVVKVFSDDPAPRRLPAVRICAARNEEEPLQLALRSGRRIRGLRVEVEPPKAPSGAILPNVEVNVVGYVPIDHPTSYYHSESPQWHRKVPDQPGRCDGWPGMWPDPLLPSNRLDLEANSTRAVWINVTVPKDAAEGNYQGTARFTADEELVAEVPFSVHVWDFTLPDENHLAAIYDVRLGPGSELWGKPLEQMYPQIVRYMAAHRLCPDTIRPGPEIRLEGGEMTADFTKFDMAARLYFDKLKLPFAYTPWTFYLFGWGHPPKTFLGQRPYPGDPPYEDVDRTKLRPEFKNAYQTALALFWDHVKEQGWDKKVVLYISDEPFDRHEHIRQQMQALCDMIREVDPDIPIYSSTWKHVPPWDGYLDVWGIGHDGRVSAERMEEIRTQGGRIWFTTDGQMCTDTPYCAVERLLPHYCFRYGAEAYEFWGVGWLTYDPYRYGWHAYIRQSSEPGSSYWIRYPNGDGFLLYPGAPIGVDGIVSSIRFEQAREGVEDYEYLYLLRQLAEKATAKDRAIPQADAALQAAADLVSIPNPGGRYSSQILPDPNRLYEVRCNVAEAIEALKRMLDDG